MRQRIRTSRLARAHAIPSMGVCRACCVHRPARVLLASCTWQMLRHRRIKIECACWASGKQACPGGLHHATLDATRKGHSICVSRGQMPTNLARLRWFKMLARCCSGFAADWPSWHMHCKANTECPSNGTSRPLSPRRDKLRHSSRRTLSGDMTPARTLVRTPTRRTRSDSSQAFRSGGANDSREVRAFELPDHIFFARHKTACFGWQPCTRSVIAHFSDPPLARCGTTHKRRRLWQLSWFRCFSWAKVHRQHLQRTAQCLFE